MEADLAECLLQLGAGEPALGGLGVEHERSVRPDEEEVGVDEPGAVVGEDVDKGGSEGGDDFGVETVQGHPLRHHAARGKVLQALLVVVLGVEGGYPGEGEGHGLEGDEVVGLLRNEQVVAPIVDVELQPFAVEHAEVVRREERGDLEDVGGNLDRVDVIEAAEGQCATGDARAEAHEEHVLHVAVEEVGQHALQAVHAHAALDGGSGLHAVDPQHTVGARRFVLGLGHDHGSLGAFAHGEHFVARRHVAHVEGGVDVLGRAQVEPAQQDHGQ